MVTLTANVDTSATYTGEWELKDRNTELKLDIDGTEALHDIDKGWDVEKLSARNITLTDDDNGQLRDKLILVKAR